MNLENESSKNKAFLALYCVIVFALLCAPLALFYLFPGGADTEIARDSAETTATVVEATADTVSAADVPVAAGGRPFIHNPLLYYGDNFERSFGLRLELISLDVALHSSLFGESPNQRVIMGRDGWLFLSETVDPGAPANSFTDNLLHRISHSISLVNEYLDKNDVDFLVAIPPNKSSIYPENLPYYAKPPLDHGSKLLTRLHSSLAVMGISYVDLTESFHEVKRRVESPSTVGEGDYSHYSIADADLYHKLDTHWNNMGAYLAYTDIMNAVADMPKMKERGLHFIERTRPIYEERADFPGDLDRMLSPESERLDTQYYLSVERAFRSQKPLVNMEEMEIVTTSTGNDMRLLMFRDSFANTLIPFISNSFGEAAYMRALPYPVSRAVSREYDVVVMEIVERNIPMIVQAAPIMPAPMRQVSLTTAKTFGSADGNSADNAPAFAEISIAGQFDKICGFFDPAMLNNTVNTAVCAVLTPSHAGRGKTAFDGGDPTLQFVFEAFPILDPSIRELAVEKYGEAAENSGFTLYVDGAEIPEGQYELRVLVSEADFTVTGQSITQPIIVYKNPME